MSKLRILTWKSQNSRQDIFLFLFLHVENVLIFSFPTAVFNLRHWPNLLWCLGEIIDSITVLFNLKWILDGCLRLYNDIILNLQKHIWDGLWLYLPVASLLVVFLLNTSIYTIPIYFYTHATLLFACEWEEGWILSGDVGHFPDCYAGTAYTYLEDTVICIGMHN